MRHSTLFVSLLVTTIAVQLAPANAQTCPGNLVKNGGFRINTVIVGNGSLSSTASHTEAWTAAYNPISTPQLQGGAGCPDPNYVSFWGNQKVGEAIQQPIKLQKDHHYSIQFCARFLPDRTKTPTFVNIVLRASSAPLQGTSCPAATCETMMTTQKITSTSWSTFQGCFTPLRDESVLTISPSNESNVDDGSLTSFGQVDNVCIREIQPVIEGPTAACTSPSTYCVKPPAAGPFTWSVPSGTTSTPINADGSCIAVAKWPSTNPGTIQVTSTVNGCPLTSTLQVRGCQQCSACTEPWNPKLDSFEYPGTLNVSMNAGTQQAMVVRATVLGAWHTGSPHCSPTGPITATASSAQPPTSGWTVSVPIVHGNQIVWSSGGQTLGTFSMNLDLSPGTGGMSCNDTVTVVVEFDLFGLTGIVPCQRCTVIRALTFGRCPLCA